MKTNYIKLLLVLLLTISCSSDEDDMDTMNPDGENNSEETNQETENTRNNTISLTVNGEEIVFEDYKAELTEFGQLRSVTVEGSSNPDNLLIGTGLSISMDINKLYTDPSFFTYVHKDTTYSSFPSEAKLKIDITQNDGEAFKATFSGNVQRDFFVDGSFKTFEKTIENGIIDINNIEHLLISDYTGGENKNILKAKIDGEDVWFYNLKTSELTGDDTTIYFEAETEKTFDRSIDFNFTKGIIGNPNVTDFDYLGDNGYHSLDFNGTPFENAFLNFDATVNNDEKLIATFSGVFSKTSGEEVTIENGYIEYYYE